MLRHLPSMGPSCGPIFVGHIGKDCDQSNNQNLMHELHFDAPYTVEGIHVVPQNLTPPGFDICGKTKPDMFSGDFHLQLHGRNSKSNEIELFLDLTVKGGVQWVAVPPRLSSCPVDYLAISGTFELLSLIIHGLRLDPDVRPPFVGPPFVLDARKPTFNLRDFDGSCASRKFLSVEDSDISVFLDDMLAQSAVSQSAQTWSAKLKKMSIANVDIANISAQRKSRDIYFSQCLVSLESVAALVESIFSFDVDKVIQADLSFKLEAFLDLKRSLLGCLQVCPVDTLFFFLFVFVNI